MTRADRTIMRQTVQTSPSQEGQINLKQITSKIGDLPPMLATAMKAMQMTKDPKVAARDLQSVISQDQALSARILRIVNSAVYCFRRKVSTISHAVAILGMETIRSIIMAASIHQLYQSGMRMANDLGTKLMADHSWGSAVAARVIAQRVRYGNPEEAFLCGLMHDIGKPVLLQSMPIEYLPIVNEVYMGGSTFHELEMLALGFSHAHVGALLAAKWNFPPQLSEAIGYHHNPLSARNFAKLTCVTSLSNRMMILLEVGFERNRALKLGTLPEVDFLKLNQSALDAIVNEVQTVRTQMTDTLAI